MNIIMLLALPLFLMAIVPSGVTKETENLTKNLAIFYTIEGEKNIEKKYSTVLEKDLKNIGFNLTNPHKRVNDQYKKKYGSTTLDILSFMSVVNDETILPLLNIDPRIAGYAPFNMLIYKKLDENTTQIGHLLPDVMLNILGIKNTEIREKFSASFKDLDETLVKKLNAKVSYIPYKKLPEKTMINFEYEFDAPDDIEDFIDEFQNTFELAFINKGYLIAGYHNFMDATDNAEEILSDYSAFWTYSLCHLEFSYNVFDTDGARPEAGIFAPCTMYLYIRKGTRKVVVGMPRLHNWSDTLDITSKKRLGLIEKLDKQIPEILKNLNMKPVPNVNPLQHALPITAQKNHSKNHSIDHRQSLALKEKETSQVFKIDDSIVSIVLPEVPKAIQLSDNNTSKNSRTIKFSKRVPPDYDSRSFEKKEEIAKEKEVTKAKVITNTNTNTNVGKVVNGRISTYLRGGLLDINVLKDKLATAGFDVIASVPVNKDGTLISVVFTSKALIHMAKKENRGFMASLHVLLDTKEETMSITNPLYLAKGFLQDDFDEKAVDKILTQLTNTFSNLKNSKDSLKYQLLSKYQFMIGMPYYKDMIEVASGEDLIGKIKNNKNIVFSQKLGSNTMLVGIKLGKRTRSFTQRIGRNNAALLPYTILIENGKAKILDPKYYISFMYPNLSMSEFMAIATTPDAIIKDCEKIFK